MSWWSKIAQGIMIVIAGYELGKESFETTENKITRYELPTKVDTENIPNIPDVWLAVTICAFMLLIVTIAMTLKSYMKFKYRQQTPVHTRI